MKKQIRGENLLEIKERKWTMAAKKVRRNERDAVAGRRTFNEMCLSGLQNQILQTYLRDIVGLAPDHCSKVNISMKEVK